MAERRHTCPHPECDKQIRLDLFACRRHWNALSQPVRRAIWDTYRARSIGDDRIEAIEAARDEWAGGL